MTAHKTVIPNLTLFYGRQKNVPTISEKASFPVPGDKGKVRNMWIMAPVLSYTIKQFFTLLKQVPQDLNERPVSYNWAIMTTGRKCLRITFQDLNKRPISHNWVIMTTGRKCLRITFQDLNKRPISHNWVIMTTGRKCLRITFQDLNKRPISYNWVIMTTGNEEECKYPYHGGDLNPCPHFRMSY
jgi:aryl carrier-like protein